MLHFHGIEYAQTLAELHTQSFSEPWSLAAFQQILSLPTSFGFCSENGFILCSDLKDDLEILTFAVNPSHRRQGIGSALLTQLQNFAVEHNKKHIFLEVSTENKAALALYHKYHFTQTGCRKNYYHEHGKNIDALCLTWQNPHQGNQD